MNVISLTVNEKMVLEYIESFIRENGVSPTFQEIKDNFGFASYNSVQRYLKQLQAKGYVSVPGGNQKRAITLLQSSSALRTSLALVHNHDQPTTIVAASTPSKDPAADKPQRDLLSLPLLGKVAAGRPLEAVKYDEFTEVPPSMVRDSRRSYTLEVTGNSMIEDGIFNGDVLIVQEQSTARNGEIAICMVDKEATVKRYYLHKNKSLSKLQVELRPANSEMESLWYNPQEVEIRGIVVGLLRKF